MAAEKSLRCKMKTLLDCKIVSLTYSLEIFIKRLAEWSVFLWRCPVEWERGGSTQKGRNGPQGSHTMMQVSGRGKGIFTDLLESIMNNRKKNTTVSQDYLLSLSLFEMKCHMQLMLPLQQNTSVTTHNNTNFITFVKHSHKVTTF